MADNLSTAGRSRVMSSIRSKHTAPEMLVRRYLHGQGFRYRLHDASLSGKPDIILPKYKVVIFVQGCFWHQHALQGHCSRSKAAVTPESNVSYWSKKLARNIERDYLACEQLKASGWLVLIVWECQLSKQYRGSTLSELSFRILANSGGEVPESIYVC